MDLLPHRLHLLTAVLGLLVFGLSTPSMGMGKGPAVDKMEPPHWWNGGTEREFVLVLHGPKLADCTVSTEEPRLTVMANERRDHEDYLFVRMRVEPGCAGPRTKEADATCVITVSGRRVGAPELEHEAGGCGGGEGRRVGAGARVGSGTRVVDDAERTDLWSSTGAVPRALLNASSPLTAERETSGSAARRVPARSPSRSSSESDDLGSMSPVEPYRIVLDVLRDPEPARLTVPNFTERVESAEFTQRSATICPIRACPRYH